MQNTGENDLITALRPENCGLEFYFDAYTQRYAIRAATNGWNGSERNGEFVTRSWTNESYGRDCELS